MTALASHTPRLAGHWLWSLLWADKRLWLYTLCASLLLNVFALATPFFTMAVYDRVLPTHSLDSLTALTAGIVVLFLFDQIIRFLRTRLLAESEKRIDYTLGNRLFAALSSQNEYRSDYSAGAACNAMQAYTTVRRFLSRATTLAIGDLPFALFILGIIAAFAGPRMAVWPLAAAVCLCLLALAIRHWQSRRASAQQHDSTQRSAFLTEAFNNLTTLRSSAGDGYFQRRWQALQQACSDADTRNHLVQESAQHLSHLTRNIAIVGLLVSGVQLVISGALTAGALIACMMLSQRVFQTSSNLFALVLNASQARAMAAGIEQACANSVQLDAPDAAICVQPLQSLLQLRAVSLASRQDTPLLDNISLNIKAGEKIAIVGRNGAGKSSLLRVLMGLEPTAQGQVVVDGVDLRQLDLQHYRSRIGYVPQEVQLFNTSLRDNVCLRDAAASDAAIQDALYLSGFSELCVQGNAPGLKIGEQGLCLSGGLRQSLVLARALLNRPSLLLLDEPSSHLDKAIEMTLVQRWLRELSASTVVLVTHRMPILALVDRIIVMDAGRISMDGPKSQVLAQLRAENLQQVAS